jgi:uncharacterized protein YjbI with pentapeptide repeats
MDNAAFDRLARLLGSGASRRHTLRALITAALAGGTADELLARDKKKDRDKVRKQGNDRDGNNDNDTDKDKDKDKDRRHGRGGQANAEAKKKNKNKQKRKKKKKKNTNGGNSGGNSCAGTPLQPGQDFGDCDFSDANLRGKNLKGSLFKNVDLTDADLCGADLESSSFADTKLIDANLTDVNLDSTSHSKGDFSGANLTNVTFRVATFSKVDFSGADLTGVDFTGATFADTDFAGAIFCRTIQPNGNVDNSDCDICDNECGLCEDCDDEDCTPPDCCPNPEGPGGICVDTDTDPLNCGGCDAACFTNLSNACVDGHCVCGNEPECSGVETCCRGEGGGATRCIDTDTDPLHCGACNEACLIPLNPCLSVECQGGECVEVGAADGTPCELEGDPGVCCAAGSSVTCVVGTECCGNAQCDAGEACCEGQCIDVEDDPNNCGGCDVICLTPTNPCLTNECIEGACTEGTLSDGTECEAFEQTGVCCGSGGTSTCVFGAECCTDAQCGSGNSCCSGQCLNTSTNFDRCGSCTNVCPEGRATACVGGACVCGSSPACAENEFCCPDGCFDLDTSFTHCGTCVFACPATRADNCTEGQCQCGSGSICEADETCCNGQCVDTDTDTDNCGTCGNACDPPLNSCNTVLCLEGTCNNFADPDGTICVEGQDEGVCCFDDNAAVCLAGAQCCSGTGCDVTEACCDNQCVNSNTDFDHCGICDNSCVPGRADACFEGQCRCGAEFQCSETETCCNGQCVNLQDDPGNCGGCGVECPTPTETCLVAQCISGGCQVVFALDGEPCSEGAANGICCFNVETSICVVDAVCCDDTQCVENSDGDTCCGNQCVDTASDPDNCGSCGEICGANETCVESGCVCPGIPCEGQCLADGPDVCCLLADCEGRLCHVSLGCNGNVCEYQQLADNTDCGFGGTCEGGVCIGQSE